MLLHLLRINRNIVECKELKAGKNGINGLVLIETLWNVKIIDVHVYISTSIVLIETLWNVKHSTSSFPIAAVTVLIETLWNVKLNARSNNF